MRESVRCFLESDEDCDTSYEDPEGISGPDGIDLLAIVRRSTRTNISYACTQDKSHS